jgi:hypothetical protein
VPAGRYLTGTLVIGDNTFLHLAAGAVLQAVPDPAYVQPDAGRQEHGGNGIAHSFSRLVLFDRAENAGLIGAGALDASGLILRNQHGRRIQVIDAHDCTNLTIEGVVLRNTGSWTLHLLHCDGVRVADVNIIADWRVSNSDGIDPDSCRNVTIERVFCYTGDDSIAIKATRNSDLLQSSYNIVIRDSVVMTRKTALKVGTETIADISNVLFENIDVIGSSRGLAIWARDGGTIANVCWRDIRMDLYEYRGESRSGQPFYFMGETRRGASRVRNILVQDVVCSAPWFSLFEANTPWPIGDVHFHNIEWQVKPRADKKDQKYLFEFEHAGDITFENFTIDWRNAKQDQWKGLWADDAPIEANKVKQLR